MKKNIILIISCLIVSSFVVFKREDNQGIAKVEKIEGKEVYLFAEPLRPYKVIEDYDNSRTIIQSCNLRNLVSSYINRGKKDKVNFDALYMNTEENIYLIKFIKEAENK